MRLVAAVNRGDDDDMALPPGMDWSQQLVRLREALGARMEDLNNIGKQCKGVSPSECKKVASILPLFYFSFCVIMLGQLICPFASQSIYC